MPTWHEDDCFWETFAPTMFREERMVAAVADVDGVLALTETPAGAAILDLPCGPGRHSLELGRRGYEVTGVDRTARHLDRAREAAAAEGLPVEFLQADMREFCRPEAFELVINLFTSFGYFEDPAEDRQVARNFLDCLKPGGKVVMELTGKEILARIFRPSDWQEVDGVLYLQERRVCDDWGWIENRWIAVRDGQRRDFCVAHRLYSATELKALLRDVGFVEVRAFGSLAGEPYDEKARRLVILGEKV